MPSVDQGGPEMHPTTSTRFEHDDGFMGRMAGSPPIAWLLICFVLVWVPHTYRYVKHHPDERHYTDAAVAMVQSGDYLTPRTADGGLRLNRSSSHDLAEVLSWTALPFVLKSVL